MHVWKYARHDHHAARLLDYLGWIIHDRLAGLIWRELQYRTDQRELLKLNEQILQDIGLHRCESHGTACVMPDENLLAGRSMPPWSCRGDDPRHLALLPAGFSRNRVLDW